MAAVRADLHPANTLVAAEGHAAKFHFLPDLERIGEPAAAHLRRVDAAGGGHENVRAPTLLGVETRRPRCSWRLIFKRGSSWARNSRRVSPTSDCAPRRCRERSSAWGNRGAGAVVSPFISQATRVVVSLALEIGKVSKNPSAAWKSTVSAIRLRLDHCQQRGQRHAFPDGVGNQAAADAVRDALHRRLLLNRRVRRSTPWKVQELRSFRRGRQCRNARCLAPHPGRRGFW